MDKRIKIAIVSIVLLVVLYYGGNTIYVFKNMHHTELTDYKRYLWIFKDSVKCDVDTFFFRGEIKDRDILYNYNIKNDYIISVWEFKDLGKMELDKIPIKKDKNLNIVTLNSWEMINKDAINDPHITMKLNFSFNNDLIVNLNENSKRL